MCVRRSGRPLVVEAKRKRQLNKESRIGKVPVTIPKGVSVTLDGQKVTVKVPPSPPPAPRPAPPLIAPPCWPLQCA